MIKTELIRFRCTPEQRKRIDDAASRANLSLTEYVLSKLFVATGSEVVATSEENRAEIVATKPKVVATKSDHVATKQKPPQAAKGTAKEPKSYKEAVRMRENGLISGSDLQAYKVIFGA